MNKTLQAFARNHLKAGLAQLPEGWQLKFKLMYATPRGQRTPEDTERIKSMDVNEVVDAMPVDKLDWAMEQVDNSLKKMGV